MHHRSFSAILGALFFLIAGNALAQKTVEEIVARVNGDIILKSELETARNTLRTELAQQQKLSGAQLEQAIAEQSKNLLRDLIDQNLLLQQAKDAGLTSDLEVVKTMERMRQEYKFETMEALEKAISEQGYNLDEYKQNIRTRYLTTQVLSHEVYPKIIVTTEEIRNYYDSNLKNFDRPAGLRVSEITIYTENKPAAQIASQKKKAEDALAGVKAGGEFAQMAQKYSEAPTAQDGGDLGFFVKGELAKPLEDVASKLEKGQTSDIITMPYGFVILKLDDKHDGGVLSFDIAQREVTDVLFQQRLQPKIREYLTKLRGDGFVEVRPGNVDSGAVPEKSTKVSEVNSSKN